MENVKLSKRLETAAKFTLKDKKILDIGSDHAYLPIYLIQNKQSYQAIAGEVAKGPYLNAKNKVQEYGLEKEISVRLGDGFDVLKPNESIGTVFICGMGGTLIRKILAEGLQKNPQIKKARLVMQPNNGEKNLRLFLQNNQLKICKEEILVDKGKIYEIIVAEKNLSSEPVVYTDEELLFGPYLLKEKSPIFIDKWQKELSKNERILKQIDTTKKPEKSQYFKEVIEKIKKVIR